uniref:3HCDH_N domain-containing protein n=1 Tax=Macrostomum lignano TaxID=282301 RepID=A0A1I8IFF4_9PLAT
MVKCAVLGCGLMGCKIAGELARQGHRVKMTDSNAEVLNSAYQRMEEDKQELLREGLLMQGAFPGQVLCLSRLEETVSDAEFIFEAVHDNLDTKSDLLEKVSHVCQPEAVISTNTLHLDVNEVFARCAKRERCLGLRFLFPVYYIPEVEINPSRDTSSSTTERVRRLLEDMGKTLFFRSGGNPLILTEEQREERRRVLLHSRRDFCPVCRQPIQDVIKVYHT